MKILMLQLIPLVSVICAAVLAFHGISGWGWFLVVALLCSGAGVVQTRANS